MTRKQRRGILIGTCLIVLAVAAGLVLFAMRDSIVFFYSPSDVAELLYPLRRARQFAYQYRSYEQRPSHREFVESLDFYEKLVDEVDAARADEQRWHRFRAKLTARAEAFLDQVRITREALEREK